VTASPRFLVRALVAALFVAPVLTACSSTNFGAQTDKVYTPADGVTNRDGMVDVLNALIVSDNPGTGRLIAGLSNNDTQTADELTGVAGAGNSQALTVTIEGGDTKIPPGGFLQLADPGSAFVQVQGDPTQLYAGAFARVTFSFKNADAVTVNVPVLAPGQNYTHVSLEPSPTPTPSPSPSGSAKPGKKSGSSSKGG
jgi:hypothetical protein